MKNYVGIDLGGTNVRVALVDEKGNILHQIKSISFAQDGPQKVMENIHALLKQLGDFQEVAGMGVAVPGPVDKRNRMMTLDTNLPGFAGYPIADILEKRWHLPVYLDNDANAAGLAEALLGAGKGKESVYYITHSTGIGGAYILHGRSIGGRKGYAGEIANIVVNRQSAKCNHLAAGAIENEASGAVLKKIAQERFAYDNVGELFTQSVHRTAEKEVVQQMAYDMAQLLATIAHVLDPDIFIIGGGVAQHAHYYYFPQLKTYYYDLVHPAMRDVPITLATLPEPGIVGASLLAHGVDE